METVVYRRFQGCIGIRVSIADRLFVDNGKPNAKEMANGMETVEV